MRSKQTGVTFIGWMLLLIPLAICLYAALRLTPIYLNYMKVARTLEQVKSELKDGGASTAAIRNSLEKHLDIEQVEFPSVKDIKITRNGKGFDVEAEYDDQAPLFSNVFVLVTFHKTVTLGGGGASD